MKSVLDPIFIRRPRINYVSPPICEVLFSSSAFPIIVLNPIHKRKGPTGLVIGGRGHVRLRWDIYPGALCYNIYVSGVITPVSNQCHNADGSPCGDPTDGSCLCCQCSNTLTLLKECIQFPEDGFPIDGFGCYYVTAITTDGESELSDPYCFNQNTAGCPPGLIFNQITFSCECPAIICPAGQHQDPNTCQCVDNCTVQPCIPGFHWDPVLCECVADSGCTGGTMEFIDDLGMATLPGVSPGTGGRFALTGSNSLKPYVYWDRISQSIDNFASLHPGATGNGILANANEMVFGTEGPDYFWLNAPINFIQAVPFPPVALGAGESFIPPLRMNATGKFVYKRTGVTGPIDGHVYRPATNDWLTVLVPAKLGTDVRDMNDSDVVAGAVKDLFTFLFVAVTITGGTVATTVVLPADAPLPPNVQSVASKINNAGTVAGYWSDITGLGTLSPFVNIAGSGPITIINGDAQMLSLVSAGSIFLTENNTVAGTVVDLNTGVSRGFFWTQSGGLILLSDSVTFSPIYGVNNAGYVIGELNGVPSLWKSGVWTPLSTLGFSTAGWTGVDISNTGEINNLTSDGFFGGGGTLNGDPGHSFVAKICL